MKEDRDAEDSNSRPEDSNSRRRVESTYYRNMDHPNYPNYPISRNPWKVIISGLV